MATFSWPGQGGLPGAVETLTGMGAPGKDGLWRTARLWQSLLMSRVGSVQQNRFVWGGASEVPVSTPMFAGVGVARPIFQVRPTGTGPGGGG